MTTNLFDAFETDASAEENGKWFEDIFGDGTGLGLKLRRNTSKVVQKANQRILNANRKLMVKGKFPEGVDERLGAQLQAEAIIVDWQGVQDPSDPYKELPFSPEVALTFLVKLPNLRRVVANLSSSMDAFKAEGTAEIEGN